MISQALHELDRVTSAKSDPVVMATLKCGYNYNNTNKINFGLQTVTDDCSGYQLEG